MPVGKNWTTQIEVYTINFNAQLEITPIFWQGQREFQDQKEVEVWSLYPGISVVSPSNHKNGYIIFKRILFSLCGGLYIRYEGHSDKAVMYLVGKPLLSRNDWHSFEDK